MSEDSRFKIKTEHFEGPLDLLLDLVEKRKLLINEFSLAGVTEEYLQFAENLSDFSVSERTEFIVVASTLLLIKSRSLLPSISLTMEEEDSIEDLNKRLKLLQIIRDGGEVIQKQFGKHTIFPKENNGIKNVIFSPHGSITLSAIFDSLNGVVARFPKKDELPKKIIKQIISLEEMMEKLASRIQNGLSLSFNQFGGGDKPKTREEKVEVIVGFLAMLELVKQGVIMCMQENLFEDIKMESNDVAVPRYS